MQVVLTSEDLTRIRIIGSAGLHVEAALAIDTLNSNTVGHFGEWKQRVRNRYAQHGSTLRLLGGSNQVEPELRWYQAMHAAKPRDELSSAQRQFCAELDEFAKLMIAPYWAGIQSHLEIQRDTLCRVAATGGVERLLHTLHPKVRWEAPVLRLPSDPDRVIHAEGNGLILCPSAFLYGKSAICIEPETKGGPLMLLFAAPPDQDAAKKIWGGADCRPESSLAALLGRTRASVLRELVDSRTTTEIARLLGVSVAAASQHTTVLRSAGLITTRRHRNSVLHTVTELGVHLLGYRANTNSVKRVTQCLAAAER